MTTIAKALTGAVIAGLGALGTALLDDSIKPVEWVGVASAFVVALGAVWGVPNSTPADRHRKQPGRDVAS